jgi:hypothetical protein
LPSGIAGSAVAGLIEDGITPATVFSRTIRRRRAWYQKAADQGNDIAQENLAFMYSKELGARRTYVLAQMLYNLAAEKEAPRLLLASRHAASGRDRVATSMTPAQITEAQKLAREWKPAKQPIR